MIDINGFILLWKFGVIFNIIWVLGVTTIIMFISMFKYTKEDIETLAKINEAFLEFRREISAEEGISTYNPFVSLVQVLTPGYAAFTATKILNIFLQYGLYGVVNYALVTNADEIHKCLNSVEIYSEEEFQEKFGEPDGSDASSEENVKKGKESDERD